MNSQMDPYVYKGTNILINKLNIRDEQELIDIETQFFIANVLDIPSALHKIDFSLHGSVQQIHQLLFENIYSWAGEFRTVNIYKPEQVLNGLSISYSDKSQIERDLTQIFNWHTTVQWNNKNNTLAEDFARFMTELWRIHPFREGNTRTTSVFMDLFAKKNGLEFNGELLSQHPGYLRKALVLAAVEKVPEPEYLLRMLKDALNVIGDKKLERKEEPSKKYKMIKQYDVTKYKQKPFKTSQDSYEKDD